MHGFQNIIFIGDSGGNQAGQRAVAEKLTAEWKGSPVIAHIQEYYTAPPGTPNVLRGLGVVTDGMPDDGLHDSPGITLNMMLADPSSVRWFERVQTGHATINGVSLVDLSRSLELARMIVEARATRTVDVINRAIAHGGTLPATP
jgi:creatinine amidohydrolase/Fe(II)-dependent formamide hydrolase-like protein